MPRLGGGGGAAGGMAQWLNALNTQTGHTYAGTHTYTEVKLKSKLAGPDGM